MKRKMLKPDPRLYPKPWVRQEQCTKCRGGHNHMPTSVKQIAVGVSPRHS